MASIDAARARTSRDLPGDALVAIARCHVPSDERVLYAARPSWRWVALHLTTPAIILTLAVLLVYGMKDGVEGVLPALAPIESWAVPLLIGIGVAKAIWQVLVRLSRLFIATDRRVVARFGVLNRGALDLPLERIQEAILRRNLDERIFGVGTIGFATAAGGVDLAWVGIARPREAYAMVQRLLPRAESATGNRQPAAGGEVAVPEAPGSRQSPRPGGTPSPRRDGAPARPVIIGIVGGIGSGKSRVAAAFESLGCVVSDSDREAKQALEREDIKKQLREWWGEAVVGADGSADRAVISRIVFSDAGQRARLEGLIHPILRSTRDALIADAAGRGVAAVILDAPLLFEAGLDKECDAIVFVDAPREARLTRVAASRGWSDDELSKREAAQMSLEEKRRRATHIVENRKDGSDLVEQAAAILRAQIPGWSGPEPSSKTSLA